MASVAKWLRQWIVVPPFAGSSPVVRPGFSAYLTLLSPTSDRTTVELHPQNSLNYPHSTSTQKQKKESSSTL